VSPSPHGKAESIRQRIRNCLRERGEDMQFGLQRYARERFLYRLGCSPHRERFVLKGAALFALWGGTVYRPTRDLDFAGSGCSESGDVVAAFRQLCDQGLDSEELRFDSDSIAAEPIRVDSEYQGLRLRFDAWLGKSRIPMLVDIGFADAIRPPPDPVEYPTLLEDPPPRILAYPREAVIAEKHHAMVLLGDYNSRFKDFYDVYSLASQFKFQGTRLAGAIAATFKRRRSEIGTTLPVALTPEFYTQEDRDHQWHGYLKRSGLIEESIDFEIVGETILAFLCPIRAALASDELFTGSWPPGGPWQISS